MTEQEWLSSGNPRSMLDFLRGRGSQRKLRLFAVGYSRRFREKIAYEPIRLALDVPERYADGLATRAELQHLRERAYDDDPDFFTSGSELGQITEHNIAGAACDAAADAAVAVEFIAEYRDARVNTETGNRVLCSILLRDVFGNPFQRVQLSPDWLTGAIREIATSIYTDRAFDRLPILADALEEAGCTDAAILEHCRGPGPHERGCWVVDLLLGKE
jgi:hypothetical protein